MQANPKKSLPPDAASLLEIKLLNHRPQLLLFEARLPQLIRHSLQVLEVNITLLLRIEQIERAVNFLPRIPRRDALRRQLRERMLRDQQLAWVVRWLVVGGARSFLLLADRLARDAVRGEDVHEFGLGDLEAEGAQRDAKFVVVEVSVAVEIEKRELPDAGNGISYRNTWKISAS